MRPTHLNSTIAALFIAGSSCFVAGSLPAYVDAVGVTADAWTYFVGSIFFTAAAFLQLLQAQTPATTRIHDRDWLAAVTQFAGTILFNVSTLAALVVSTSAQQQDRHVWRPDMFGSTLFLISSVFGVAALGGATSMRRPIWSRSIAWLNLTGSVLFMAAAVAGYLPPSTGEVLNLRVDMAGTLLGALCFLLGAVLMFPAWRFRAGSDGAAHPSVMRTTKEAP